MTAIIETRGLTREFTVRDGLHRRRITAVDDLSVTVQPGEAVSYIGANGAGKSTTIKMLTGILVPTRGEVRTCGLRPVQDRRRLARQVGVVFGQRSQLWWDLPVRDSFGVLAAIHGLDRSRERASTDEPTIGLDVLSKQRLREFLIAQRANHGTTLLLTTHDTGDIERLCDRVLVIDRGQLVYDGTLPGLSPTVGAQPVLVGDLAEQTGDLTGIPDTQHLRSEGQGLRQRLAFDAERHRGQGADRRLGAGRGARPVRGGAGHRGRGPQGVRRPPLRAIRPAAGLPCSPAASPRR